jgi:hypothetical protein
MYFMSTPAFVHLFTTYNNDSLAMGLSGLIIAVCLQYYFKPKFYVLIILFILAAFGVYTKYNLVLLFFTIGVVLFGAVLFKAIKIKMAFKIVIPLFLGCLTLVPYMRLHNYAYTGKYLADNADKYSFSPYWDIRSQGGRLHFFLKPPATTNGEWTDPYAFDSNFHYELSAKPFYWTKRTFLSSILTTSLFGEYNYSAKVPSADKWAWITLWIQVILLFNISYIPKNVRIMNCFLVISLLVFGLWICFSHYIYNSVNFRFFAWIIIPLCVLTASELTGCQKENIIKYRLLVILLTVGCWAHVLFFNTLNNRLP